MTVTESKSQWRKHLQGKTEAMPPAPHVAVDGSMTAEPIEPYLGTHLLSKGFENPHITIAPFNQLQRLCADPASVLSTENIDALVILWRLEDMFPELLQRFLCGDATAATELMAETMAFVSALSGLREKFSGTLIVSTPPYPSLPGFDGAEILQPISGSVLHAEILEQWIKNISSIPRLHILDLNALLRKTGAEKAHDARKWHLYRQPYTEAFWHTIGTQAGRLIAAQTISAKKCIVLDADNTLWGGIVGEDGVEGLALADDFPGSAYREFQKHLLHLHSRGILLAVASKNNPDDFYAAFDSHDAMVLKREHISAFEVHWDSKVDSMRRIAEKLNISTNALVFIDDSPKEIGEVQDRVPDVTCLLVPEEAAYLPDILRGTDLFDTLEITDEDRKRATMIAAEDSRRTLQSGMSEEDYKKALELELHVFEAAAQHVGRVTQLINKTNQFNLTTRRRTRDEVESLMQSPTHRVLGMSLKDKYGDYGLVGVCILEKSNDEARMDTLLMSCRVLGRDAETAFLAQIAETARRWGCKNLAGTYLPTPKNGMVKNLYAQHGFTQVDDSTWRVTLDTAPTLPAHIKAALDIAA